MQLMLTSAAAEGMTLWKGSCAAPLPKAAFAPFASGFKLCLHVDPLQSKAKMYPVCSLSPSEQASGEV